MFLIHTSTGAQEKKSAQKLYSEGYDLVFTDVKSALDKCTESYELFLSEKDSVGAYYAKYCMAQAELTKGNIENSIEHLNELITYYERNPSAYLGDAYSLKSIALGRLNKSKEEINYLLKARDIFKAYQDTHGLAKVNVNIAGAYIRIKKYKEAKQNLLQAEKLYNAIDHISGLFYVHVNRGNLYNETKEFDQAVYELNKARQIAVHENIPDGEATALILLATTYKEQQKLDKAIITAQESFALADINKLDQEKLDALELLHELYQEQGNYKKAYEEHLRYIELKEKLYNKRMIERVGNLENELKIAEQNTILQQQKNDLLQSKNKIKQQNLRISRDQYKRYLLAAGLALVLIISVFSYLAYKKSKKVNALISEQKHILEERNKDIMDSIHYAKKIQNAILPPLDNFKMAFQKSFVLYLPKDVVAGDFYWMEKQGSELLFAVADCTGHGVPGAMVSVICNSGLNRSVREEKLKTPGAILDHTRKLVVQEFEKSKDELKDGMDISICSWNQESNILHWSGANIPLWIISRQRNQISYSHHSNNEIKEANLAIGDISLFEWKANKFPIGKYHHSSNFDEFEITLLPGERVYLFSDGYADQFGGTSRKGGGKKYKSKNLKRLLLQSSLEDVAAQKDILYHNFIDWKQDIEQVDDICIIGIEVQ